MEKRKVFNIPYIILKKPSNELVAMGFWTNYNPTLNPT